MLLFVTKYKKNIIVFFTLYTLQIFNNNKVLNVTKSVKIGPIGDCKRSSLSDSIDPAESKNDT